MRTLKRITFCALLALVAAGAGAQRRSDGEMESLAREALGELGGEARSNSLNDVEIGCIADFEGISLWGASGYGFAVVSKYEGLRGVVGVAATDYDEESLPCGLEWWLEAVDEALASKGEMGEGSLMTVADNVEDDYYFVTTLWSQGSPYNDLCPELNGSSTVTGCLPLALSQIMNYYEYPEHGKGTGSYTLGEVEYLNQEINSVYDWSHMLDSYDDGGGTDDQLTAVSTLLFDACKASKVEFGTMASGGVASDAVDGAIQNFSYDSLALCFYYRMFYADDEWMEIVYDELESENPILYCGEDPKEGGHAFVFDGVRGDGLVHVNWGWGGSYDGWYAIDDLDPSSYSFSDSQCMIFGFRPDSIPAEGEENTSLWAIQGSYTISIQSRGRATLNFNVTGLFNVNHRQFDGTLYLVIADTLGNKTMLELYTGTIDAYYGWDEAGASYDITDLEQGTYLIYLVSKSTEESDYQYVRSLGGVEFFTLTVGERNRYTIEQGDLTGVVSAVTTEKDDEDDGVRVYDTSGRLLGTSTEGLSGIVIVKEGGETKKVLLTK